MWSSATIQDIREEAGRTAKRNRLTPQLVEEALAYWNSRSRWNFPFLGDYVPEGWELCENIEPLFVDATGSNLDEAGGPALSLNDFARKVEQFVKAHDHYALAVLEQGPFQVVVGIYRPDRRDFTHSGKLTEKELRQVGYDKK